MKLVQCWDDGVTTDVRLVSLLRRHSARATFNLNADLHKQKRQLGWHHGDTEVWRLARGELREVYDDFSIATHTLTHPHLDQLPIDAAIFRDSARHTAKSRQTSPFRFRPSQTRRISR